MAKRKTKSEESTGDESEPFETALANLETIVTALEDGSLDLEEAMQQFEQATGLLRSCYARLEQAEQRIEALVAFDDEGRPTFTPFDATATIDGESP